jgi:hypothetical protein
LLLQTKNTIPQIKQPLVYERKLLKHEMLSVFAEWHCD